MSDILETESNAVITVKKTKINLLNSMVFEVLKKMLQVVYQSDFKKTNYASPTLRNIMA